MGSSVKCNVCKKQYSPDCDYNQGRCPMHLPLIYFQANWKTVLSDVLVLLLVAMIVAPFIVTTWILLGSR